MRSSSKKLQSMAHRAKAVLPGGVNSPVRNMKSVDNEFPFFAQRASGSKLYDIDNTEYLDWCQTWGSMILGHAHPTVFQAVQETLLKGSHFGCSTEQEVLLGEELVKSVPSLDQVRCVSSGTEATMSAIRLARGFTNRTLVVKFEGCYHGHADYFLVSAGSGVASIPQASSSGIPSNTLKDIICIPYNQTQAVEDLFKKCGDSIAAVILEPVCANMGVVLPNKNFLSTLRKITDLYGALLIFDEVITGFRIALGGAQERFNIIPDLTCLGKIIGGGFNVGAFGGRKDIMQHLAPCGNVYQAGTLSGNPIAMTAGLETLKLLKKKNFYEELNKQAQWGTKRLQEATLKSKYSCKIQSIGSLFSLFFTQKDLISCFDDVKQCDHHLFAKFYQYALENNHFLSPSGYETHFIGQAHTKKEIETLAHIIETFDV